MGVKKSLLNYFKNHLFLSFIIILIIIFVTILALVPPQILRIIVDNVVLTGETQKLFLFSILYLISYLLIGVTNFAKELVLVILSQGISTNLRKEMMMHIHKMNYENFINNDAGTLESYFSNDVDAIDALITSGIISMVIDLLKMIGIIISIFVFSTMFGFLSVAILPLIIFITFGFKKLMFKAQLNNRRIEGNVNNLVLEGLDNIITIKVFQAYNYFKNKYINVLKNHYQTIKKSNFYDSIFAPIMQIIKTIVIVAIVLISSYNYNLFGISVGVLVSIIDLITDLFKPIENLGMELQTIQKSLAGISRINQFFNFEAS
ncbi:MAG: ABC transporter transmembrane domain-containing protein, partial [Bacilli bacterium]|nr:ABC transporter transmembrane domain-containing protein [Bacilli bacterium]